MEETPIQKLQFKEPDSPLSSGAESNFKFFLTL